MMEASIRLIPIMGVQRSGTNALFRSLTSGQGVVGYNEDDPSVFDNGALRPEPSLRALFAGTVPVVIKPISETKWRSVSDVLTEFAAYDLRVLWIYRNPVDCYLSHIERWTGFRGRPEAFAIEWCDRNQSVLDALDTHGESIAIVRYEDLCSDPRVFRSLADFVGVDGRYRFRHARVRDGEGPSGPEHAQIRAITDSHLQALNDRRRFPGESLNWIARRWFQVFPGTAAP